MNKMIQAHKLAEQGFHVFPLLPDSKLPAIKEFPQRATCDKDQITAWWTLNTDYNIAIYTGRYGNDDDGALVTIDVDNKGDKHGDKTILELEFEGFVLPPSYENATTTGGRHIIYRAPYPMKQGVNVLGDGLDTRSYGGYIVAPGSTIGGKSYQHIDGRDIIVDAPQWVLDRISRADLRSPKAGVVLDGINTDKAYSRGVKFVKDLPSGETGTLNDTIFRVAAKLKDFGCDGVMTAEIIDEHWDRPASVTSEDIDNIVQNAFHYGKEPQGSDAPEAVFNGFQRLDDTPLDETDVHPFEVFNREYAYVKMGDFVLHQTTDEDGAVKVDRLTIAGFNHYTANQKMMVGDKERPIYKLWLEWADRRTFDAVLFRPCVNLDNRFYNLWRGFTYEPKPGPHPALDLFIDHALNNVCKGDVSLFKYLMAWFASIVQFPDKKVNVAVVFKGGKGVGKNALIERVGALIQRHFIVADDNRYLLSNFNSHLESTLLLVLDEACWAGDKKAEGRMKGLITGAMHNIERKGMEPYSVPNRTRVAIIGNEDWIVPASQDERRFAVFNVGDGRQQDRRYFISMREGMENGGYSHLLHYLLNLDISGVDLDDAPKTEGLRDQKIESLGLVESWWNDCLENNELIGSTFNSELPARIANNRMKEAFREVMKAENVRSRLPTDKKFKAIMARIAPSMIYKKNSHHEQGDCTYAYHSPGIDRLRADFDAYLGSHRDWSKNSD